MGRTWGRRGICFLGYGSPPPFPPLFRPPKSVLYLGKVFNPRTRGGKLPLIDRGERTASGLTPPGIRVQSVGEGISNCLQIRNGVKCGISRCLGIELRRLFVGFSQIVGLSGNYRCQFYLPWIKGPDTDNFPNP